jgi:hypothetical protein
MLKPPSISPNVSRGRRSGSHWSRIARDTPVLLEDDSALVPLETRPGRDQYVFPAGEEPPWRWKIESLHPGCWS